MKPEHDKRTLKVSDTATYLEAEALEGGEVTVEIAGVRLPGKDDIGKDGRPFDASKLIIAYKGARKEHVACRTVQKQIRRIHGNDTGGWIGKRVTLFQDTCNAFGNPRTPCIRVRFNDPDAGEHRTFSTGE